MVCDIDLPISGVVFTGQDPKPIAVLVVNVLKAIKQQQQR
jgi:hypothetical protein